MDISEFMTAAELARLYADSLKQAHAQCTVYAKRVYRTRAGVDEEWAEQELQRHMREKGGNDE